MENVEGLLTAKEGFYFTETVYRLLSAGYWVKARKLYMEQYGLPQRRKRVVVIGNLDEVEFDFPHPTHVDARQPSMLGRPGLSVLDAIGDLPSPSASGGIAYGVTDAVTDFQRAMRRDDGLPVSLHKAIAVNQVTQARINGLKQGQSMKDLPEDLQHPSFQRRAFRRVMDGTPTEKRGGAPAGLKRLVAAEPSLTITTSAMREFVHPLQDRLLTLREMARIQSFPDRFEFSGTPTSVATQIGNAVPPLFMELLARHMAASARWKPLSESGRWLGISVSESSMMSPALARMLEALEERTNGFR
jgi:DNA (cytosine-5)-methyltransferase 1